MSGARFVFGRGIAFPTLGLQLAGTRAARRIGALGFVHCATGRCCINGLGFLHIGVGATSGITVVLVDRGASRGRVRLGKGGG